MLVDRGRVGDEPVKRYERRNGGEDGEQRIERHTSGHRKDPVSADFLINTPKDVLPALRRDLTGLCGRTSAVAFFDLLSFGGRSGVCLCMIRFRGSNPPLLRQALARIGLAWPQEAAHA